MTKQEMRNIRESLGVEMFKMNYKAGIRLPNLEAFFAGDDNALDGVMIIGSGKGRLVGADEDVKYNYLDAADDMLSLFDDDQSDIYYDYSSENRTFFDDLLAGWIAPETAEEITFSDIILPGEDGKVSFEYDITDLEVFAVTALDKAFNTAEEYVDSVSAETETITPGIWADEDGFYQFNEDGSVDIRMYDQPEGVEFSGEYKDGVLKVSMNGEEASSAKSTLIYDDSAVFQDAEDPDANEEWTEEELAEERKHKFRILSGVGDLTAILVGVAVILVLSALLIQMVHFATSDLSQNFTLFATHF